jgi:hypothetical protein
MVRVVMLNVVILSVVMLSVVAPFALGCTMKHLHGVKGVVS